MPDTDALVAALTAYGFPGTVHDVINLVDRAARILAPAVAHSAMDSGCTDYRPTEAGRKRDAWDLIALAYALNAIAD